MYYSGQGMLYVADRNSDGTPKGFRPLGNVPSLSLSIETTKFEHKESMSGSRATDLSIVEEKKGSFTFTMEDIVPANLALAVWGDVVDLVSTPVASESVVAYEGYMGALKNVNVASVVVQDETDTTTYEFGTAPDDEDSKNGWIDEVNGTYYVFPVAEQTTRLAAATISDEDVLHVAYTAGVATRIDGFTQSGQVKWFRFQGLNTVPGEGQRVIVDIFKGDLDPLNEYALINDQLASVELSGSILYDELQPASGSRFFRQTNVAA